MNNEVHETLGVKAREPRKRCSSIYFQAYFTLLVFGRDYRGGNEAEKNSAWNHTGDLKFFFLWLGLPRLELVFLAAVPCGEKREKEEKEGD